MTSKLSITNTFSGSGEIGDFNIEWENGRIYWIERCGVDIDTKHAVKLIEAIEKVIARFEKKG